MDKFRFGTKEIIATVIGATLSIIVRWAENRLLFAGIVDPGVFDWVQPGLFVVALTAVFFGPVSGMLCGIAGGFLGYVMFFPSISYPRVAALGVYGFFLGMYFGKTHYDMSEFSLRTFADFNAVQMLSVIFTGMAFLPLARFLIENVNMYEEMTTGAKSVIGNSVLIGIGCPIAMFIVHAVISRNKKRGT